MKDPSPKRFPCMPLPMGLCVFLEPAIETRPSPHPSHYCRATAICSVPVFLTKINKVNKGATLYIFGDLATCFTANRSGGGQGCSFAGKVQVNPRGRYPMVPEFHSKCPMWIPLR